MDYKEYLKDTRWQIARKEILIRDGFCQKCGSKHKLQVHHIRYIKGKKPWEYPPEYLITLCNDCHKIGTRISG